MKPKQIIYKSWQVVDSYRDLMLYAFVGMFFSFIVGLFYFFYQTERIWRLFYPDSLAHLEYVNLLKQLSSMIFGSWEITAVLIGFAFVIVIGYIFIPLLVEGAIIHLLSKIIKGSDFQYRDGLRGGVVAFWRMMEYKLLTAEFSPIVILFLGITVLSVTGISALSFWYILAFMFLLSGILSVLFTFSEFFIVLRGEGPIDALVHSSGLVFFNLDKMMVMLVLVGWIFLRSAFNFLIFLLFPVLMMGMFYLLSTIVSKFIALLILSVFGSLLLVVMLYIFSFIYVLKTAIWQIFFEELDKK